MLGVRNLALASMLLSLIFLSGCDQNQISTQRSVKEPGLCDFHAGECQHSLGENIIRLSLSPANAPSEKPLNFQLKSTDKLVIASSRIEGRDMFMGVIPLKWQQMDENTFNATAVYGSCSSDYMVWRLWLSVSNEAGQSQQIWFDFLADND
ncbi:conserved hypothetical protein [Shewanella amazonensis SB2B]|uniref:Lipoprotein n=1 Tax=Shewanella amazonensis (strain ATCC BAA-1098 / SB2B) TaxID=326297 RepID=A1S6I9_SHEAM|nr:conserved hypothetical protein [Shewanella amazonensis SB2B]